MGSDPMTEGSKPSGPAKKGDYLWYSVTTLISITLNIGTY